MDKIVLVDRVPILFQPENLLKISIAYKAVLRLREINELEHLKDSESLKFSDVVVLD